jgi:hypothetical protein
MRTTTTTMTGLPRPGGLLGALVATTAFAALALVGPASALAAPVLDVSSSHYPSTVPAGTYAKYTVIVSNSGTTETSGAITVDFTVPAGLEVTKFSDSFEKEFGFGMAWSCSIAGNSRSVSCTGPEIFEPVPIEPGKEACEEFFGFVPSCRLIFLVKAGPSASLGTATPTVEACGGGAAACANASDPFEIVPLDFHITKFDGTVLKQNGDPATQAGSHPHTASTEFFFSTAVGASALGSSFGTEVGEFPTAQLKDSVVRLPPGLVGNPQAAPICTEEQLLTEATSALGCPADSQVGVVTIWFSGSFSKGPGEPIPTKANVYNMQTPHGTQANPIGTPGLFAFEYGGAFIQIYAKLRTGEDYGVTVINKNAAQTIPIAGVTFSFWGVPADPSHDTERGDCRYTVAADSCPSNVEPKPFISLPTSCVGPVQTFLDVMSWEGPSPSASFLSHDNGEPPTPIGAEGCNALDFSPSLEARPTTNVADAPSGLDVDLHIPQSEDPEGTAEAHLRDTTVTLPQGLVINPSGANGLGGCSLSQFGYTNTEEGVIHTTPGAATCPDNAKLGTVEVETPLLDHPLKGAAYIANPYANPFNSLLAIYITVDDPQTGIVVKLAGEVHADPVTGRLTTTVSENPQQPFEDFKLHFFGGAHGALRTPATCGSYSTTSSLTPWSAPESGPPATPSDFWAISQAPGGGACPSSPNGEPNKPDLDAGTASPIAGTFSPMVVNLRREDGSQNFSTVTLTPPPGLTAKLAGTPYCPEAAISSASSKSGQEEKAAPSCPAASQVGVVDVAAGAGPAPYWTQGKAYLTGPYKGAPLSLAIITPATAGPFDLGTVVVRTALHVDPVTTKITAISDPLPSILAGIPLDVRSALIHLDKPSFTLNPTSCDPLAFEGALASTLGKVAPLTERFQVGECGRLGFKPKLAFNLIGGTRRGAHPALKATLTMPEGSANIAKAVVALPHSEFLDQGHIGTVCTRVQYAARECPAASVYGQATAYSPLLDAPLSGPVYLRSSDNKLPDLVASLDGQIHVDLDGRVDSIKGGIRTTFEGVPDAAVSKFILEMQGGKKGLLQNSTNICKGLHKADVEFEAQNGKVADFAPALKAKCPKGKKRRHRPAHRAVR